MDYDPVKDRLLALIRGRSLLQKLFFAALHLLFLRAWYVRKAIRRWLPKRARVLDAGTGFGQYAYFVARAFPYSETVAVDIKADYLKQARQFFDSSSVGRRVTFVLDDLTRLATAGPFDCILAVDVLEHIRDDASVLDSFANVLIPGGVVIISTPSDQGGSDSNIEGAGGFIGEHVRAGYGRSDLERKLRQAGLTVEQSCYTYGPPGSLAWRLLIKIPMRALDTSPASLVLLPAYYALVLPLGIALHWLDVRRVNRVGTGLLMVGRKPGVAEDEAAQ